MRYSMVPLLAAAMAVFPAHSWADEDVSRELEERLQAAESRLGELERE